ncbi:hypothetical protein BS78_08G171700 [Paspalum vaginatum]|nr:hypothetical protein BS78_08G171700 [Paspalum vaginatum]
MTTSSTASWPDTPCNGPRRCARKPVLIRTTRWRSRRVALAGVGERGPRVRRQLLPRRPRIRLAPLPSTPPLRLRLPRGRPPSCVLRREIRRGACSGHRAACSGSVPATGPFAARLPRPPPREHHRGRAAPQARATTCEPPPSHPRPPRAGPAPAPASPSQPAGWTSSASAGMTLSAGVDRARPRPSRPRRRRILHS